MANFNEIINMKEFYLFNGEKRVGSISVFITTTNKFLCIMQVIAIEDNSVCMQTSELYETYKEVRTWLENVQWYANGNQYDNSKYEE